MMTSMRATLTRLGVNDEQIYTEEFLSPKTVSDDAMQETENGDSPETESAVASQVTFTRSATTIQVEPQQTLLEAAD